MPMVPMDGYGPQTAAPTVPPGTSTSPQTAECEDEVLTTVMWRNIPNNYTRDSLLQLINLHGFSGKYDFFYAPADFSNDALVGYAFINFVSSEAANDFYDRFEGFTDWSLRSDKVSEVTWSKPLQGLEGHIERYRNSPVMHPDVADDKKPLLFSQGERIDFPSPTRKIKPPFLKNCRGPGA